MCPPLFKTLNVRQDIGQMINNLIQTAQSQQQQQSTPAAPATPAPVRAPATPAPVRAPATPVVSADVPRAETAVVQHEPETRVNAISDMLRTAQSKAAARPRAADGGPSGDANDASVNAIADGNAAAGDGMDLESHSHSHVTIVGGRGAEDSEGPQCIFCYTALNNGPPVTALPCSHTFHVHCLNRWYTTHEMEDRTQCPFRCHLSRDEVDLLDDEEMLMEPGTPATTTNAVAGTPETPDAAEPVGDSDTFL